jgi:hypothetical protein
MEYLSIIILYEKTEDAQQKLLMARSGGGLSCASWLHRRSVQFPRFWIETATHRCRVGLYDRSGLSNQQYPARDQRRTEFLARRHQQGLVVGR